MQWRYEPEGRATTDDARFVAWFSLGDLTAEKSVMFDAFLPEVLAGVARVEVELDRVFVVTLQQQYTTKQSVNDTRSFSDVMWAATADAPTWLSANNLSNEPLWGECKV